MVKLERFEIELSRKNGVYFPGEEVTGNVVIKFKEPSAKITKFIVEFRGETHVEMTKMNRLRSDTHSLFQTKLELENNNYEFKFTLPSSGLATSYEHPQAYIKYWLGASIWSTQTYVIKRFTVINPLDLNLLPGLRQPYGVSDTTTVCCCPCESDPITIEFNTNKTGYVSGETIRFNATIDNRSSKSIKSISMLLYQHTRFNAQGFTSEFSLHYLSLIYNGPKIGPRMKGEWSSNDNVGLKIPIVRPSLLDTCPFIRLFYTIALEVKFNDLSGGEICLDIPIVIGTVPLLNDTKLSVEPRSIKYYKPKWDRIRTIEEIIEEQENENKRVAKEDDGSRFLSRYPYYTDFSYVFK